MREVWVKEEDIPIVKACLRAESKVDYVSCGLGYLSAGSSIWRESIMPSSLSSLETLTGTLPQFDGEWLRSTSSADTRLSKSDKRPNLAVMPCKHCVASARINRNI